MNRYKKIVAILLKDKVSKTVIHTVLTSMDICYLDGRDDERKGVNNLDYIKKEVSK